MSFPLVNGLRRWWLFIPFLLALLAYGPKLQNGLVLDDALFIFQSPYVRNLAFLPRHYVTPLFDFGQPNKNQEQAHYYYRPLSLNLMAVVYAGVKSAAWGYHLAQLLLFFAAIATSIWTLELLRRRFFFDDKFRSLPIIAAGWFAVCPVAMDAVAWFSDNGMQFCALGTLAALGFYLRWSELAAAQVQSPRARIYALACAFFLWLAVCGKEGGIFSLLLLPLVDIAISPSAILSRQYWQKRVFLLGTIALAYVIYFILRYQTFAAWRPHLSEDISTLQNILCLPDLLARYLFKTIWPWHPEFTAEYQLVDSAFSPRFWLPLSVGVLLLIKLGRSRQPILIFGAGFWLITIAPYLFIRGIRGGVIVSDRYLFLANLGAALFIAGLIFNWLSKKSDEQKLFYRRWLMAAGAVLAILCIGIIGRRLPMYRQEICFYRQVLADAPQAILMRKNLAVEFNRAGKYSDAEREINLVLAQNRRFADAATTKGIILQNQRRLAEAEKYYREGLQINAHDISATLNLGVVVEQQGDPLMAQQLYRQTLALQPNNAMAQENLARNQEMLSRFSAHQRAAALCAQAVTFLRWGQSSQARQVLEQARLSDDNFALVYQYLSNLDYQSGDLASAFKNLQRAARLEPQNELYARNLAVLQEMMEKKSTP